jgi:hypothetical protein
MEVGVQLHAPAALPPGKRPGTHFIVGWVGLRAGLDGCEESRPTPGFDVVYVMEGKSFAMFISPVKIHFVNNHKL